MLPRPPAAVSSAHRSQVSRIRTNGVECSSGCLLSQPTKAKTYWCGRRFARHTQTTTKRLVILPEVGSQAVVAFEAGDVHRPYTVGSTWSGHLPLLHGPGSSNSIRVLRTRSDSRLEFDDAAAGPKISLTTHSGHQVLLDAGASEVSITHSNGSTIKLAAAGSIEITANNAVNVTALSVTVDAQVATFSGTVTCQTLVANAGVLVAAVSPRPVNSRSSAGHALAGSSTPARRMSASRISRAWGLLGFLSAFLARLTTSSRCPSIPVWDAHGAAGSMSSLTEMIGVVAHRGSLVADVNGHGFCGGCDQVNDAALRLL